MGEFISFAWLGRAFRLVYLRYCFTLWVPGSIEFESPIPFEVSGAKPYHVSLFYQAVHVSWYFISTEVMQKSMLMPCFLSVFYHHSLLLTYIHLSQPEKPSSLIYYNISCSYTTKFWFKDPIFHVEFLQSHRMLIKVYTFFRS
jgi:hypothetical protein